MVPVGDPSFQAFATARRMTRRNAAILLVLAASVALGALREFLFLNLNYQIDFVRFDRSISYAHSLFQGWVQGAGLSELLGLKWVLSVLYIAMMALLSVLLARLLWGDHRYRTAIIIGFLVVSILALVAHFLAGSVPALSSVSIHLLHSLQYPVVLFFLVAASALGPRAESGSATDQ